MRVLPLLFITVLLLGCETNLTIHTQPEGAMVISQSGNIIGISPVVLSYDPYALMEHRGNDGCYWIEGVTIKWASGATVASDQSIRLCGSPFEAYSISFQRDPNAPGLEKDIEFALKVQSMRIQQQQADAANSMTAIQMLNAMQKTTCTSKDYGGAIIQTACR